MLISSPSSIPRNSLRQVAKFAAAVAVTPHVASGAFLRRTNSAHDSHLRHLVSSDVAPINSALQPAREAIQKVVDFTKGPATNVDRSVTKWRDALDAHLGISLLNASQYFSDIDTTSNATATSTEVSIREDLTEAEAQVQEGLSAITTQ
jgi:hypothetical protein